VGMGVAAGGLGVIGYTLPEFLEPLGLTRRGSRQLGPGAGVKQLTAGPLGAPQRAQANVRTYVGAGYE